MLLLLFPCKSCYYAHIIIEKTPQRTSILPLVSVSPHSSSFVLSLSWCWLLFILGRATYSKENKKTFCNLLCSLQRTRDHYRILEISRDYWRNSRLSTETLGVHRKIHSIVIQAQNVYGKP